MEKTESIVVVNCFLETRLNQKKNPIEGNLMVRNRNENLSQRRQLCEREEEEEEEDTKFPINK